MQRFVLQALAAAVGFWIASRIIHGVHVGGIESLLIAGFLLGIANALVRPILVILTFPLTLVTLGLFLLVVNGLMVSLVAFLFHGVHVNGLWSAILVSLVISVVSWLASGLVDASRRGQRR